MRTDPQWPGEPRATAIDADRYSTETDARRALGGADATLPYLGVFETPDGDRLHMFADGVTAEQYESAGWVREEQA